MSGKIVPICISDILVWHGDENIAIIDNQSGELRADLSVAKMFDDDRFTYWRNHDDFTAPMIIGFSFKVISTMAEFLDS